MIRKITGWLVVGLLCAAMFGVVKPANTQAATLNVNDTKSQACEALGQAASGTGGNCTTSTGPDINATLRLAINVLSMIVGFAAVVMIMIGGFKYVTSQGESAATASAKNTILYAIVGLVVVALAQIIVVFVLTRTTKTAPNCPSKQTRLANGGACTIKP